MTRVTIYSDGSAREIIAEDHATGNVQVCAAVSTLLYSLAGWLINNSEHLHAAPYVEMQPGKSHLLLDGDREAAAAFELVKIGFL